MKTKLIAVFFLAACLAVSSCQKDAPTPTPVTPTYPVEGLWIGTFTVDNNPSRLESIILVMPFIRMEVFW